MGNLILKKVIDLANFSTQVPRDKKEDYLTQAQDILLKHLKDQPKDTDAWILLTRIECNFPFYDPDRIKQYTDAVFSYDKGNVYALLFRSYMDYYILGSSDDLLIDKLLQVKSDNKELLSLIEIAKARYWECRNKQEYERCLLRSIELCKDYVTNYEMLGIFYIKQGKYAGGIALIKQALFNVDRVFTPENALGCSPADMDCFLKEFFSGLTMNFLIYNELSSYLVKYQDYE